MQQTVIQYVLSRLHSLGVRDIFGVPGDYSLPINDAICDDPHLRWIGNCNELNAAYAADGYARIKGIAAISTTYGVGELSAINGIAGAYAEHLPIFHLVGMPPTTTQQANLLVHHTLGTGKFDLFFKMTEPVVCVRTIITPANCAAETERIINAALYHHRPVYMGIPQDYVHVPIQGTAIPDATPQSDPLALETAVNKIIDAVAKAKKACILPGILISRLGLHDEAVAVLDASRLPFATMLMDKSVFDETHPAYIGMYRGQMGDPVVRDFIEDCDCILNLGAMLTDLNTGMFSAHLDPSKTIEVLHHQVRLGSTVFQHVEMKDVLLALAKRLPKHTETGWPKVHSLEVPQGRAGDPINADYLYARWNQFLKPNDMLIVDIGTPWIGLAFAHLPTGVTFHNQSLWASIGWATPAAFGAALAAPTRRRTVLITGEGSHQMTAQEICQFPRYGLKPIIFVLNNNGYLIERVLSHKPDAVYNDVATWHYQALPQALGCTDWFTARVTTCGELDQAMDYAQTCKTGAYIEVVTDTYALPQALKRFGM